MDQLVLSLCIAHVGLWGVIAARRGGLQRRGLLVVLAFHTWCWWQAVQEGRPVRGYQLVCGHTYCWASLRLTREALANQVRGLT
jgi:hypothetical protein